MFEIVVLALLQSITEFLPVSSSGHLVVVREFFGWNAQGLGLLSDLGLHIGTLGAVCVYFMKDSEFPLLSFMWSKNPQEIQNIDRIRKDEEQEKVQNEKPPSSTQGYNF